MKKTYNTFAGFNTTLLTRKTGKKKEKNLLQWQVMNYKDVYMKSQLVTPTFLKFKNQNNETFIFLNLTFCKY